MDNFDFQSADWLRTEFNSGYGNLPIPVQKDMMIDKLIQNWLLLDSQARETAASKVIFEYRFTLLAFSERMASLAIRVKDPALIRSGLVAAGIDGWKDDWRDNAPLVCLHYHASEMLKLNTRELFEDVSIVLPAKASSAFLRFLDRSDLDKSLGAMGYVAGADADGFRFIRTW